MRTVTFSDERVGAYVQEHFIPVWSNRVPSFHNCEMKTERYIAVHKGEIFASRNICSFVVDRDGNAMHLFTGFYAPDHCLKELAFGLKVHQSTRGEDGNLRTDAADRFAKLHAERRDEVKAADKELRAAKLEVPAGFMDRMEAVAALFKSCS